MIDCPKIIHRLEHEFAKHGEGITIKCSSVDCGCWWIDNDNKHHWYSLYKNGVHLVEMNFNPANFSQEGEYAEYVKYIYYKYFFCK